MWWPGECQNQSIFISGKAHKTATERITKKLLNYSNTHKHTERKKVKQEHTHTNTEIEHKSLETQ